MASAAVPRPAPWIFCACLTTCVRHRSRNAGDYRPTKQAKLWSENSGQHYPGFADRPTTQPEEKTVKVPKVQREHVSGPRGEKKLMSDDRYAAEMDAQRRRAQALAYLEQGDEGVPDDALRGAAAAKRKREKASELSMKADNTLKEIGQRQHDDASGPAPDSRRR